MMLSQLKNKKILILGFAREGRETLRFLLKNFKHGEIQIFVADQLDFGKLPAESQLLITTQKFRLAKLFFGSEYIEGFDEAQIIIKSPGVPYSVVEKSIKKGVVVTSETELFLANCPANVIGITATKGKSTTTSLIYEILKTAGKQAYLIGNIGVPSLPYLDKAKKSDWCVFEMSSHQLFNLHQSPHISVFLNVYPEHLDYYKDYEEYQNAKANIALHQGVSDYFVYNSRNEFINKLSKKVKSHLVDLQSVEFGKYFDEKKNPFAGEFYYDNIRAAIAVAKILKISASNVAKAIAKFKPLAHRLEYVGNFSGIKFYNDSLATIPQATMLAINSFKGDVDTILLGGWDRNLKYDQLANVVLQSGIKNIVFFPDSGDKMFESIKKVFAKKKKKVPAHIFAKNMKEAVEFCYKKTEKGKICLLSCAAPSFGLFVDYKDRGDQFKNFVTNHNA